MNRRRHQKAHSQVLNQLRDYTVPIIWLLLVIFIVYNVFSGGEPWTETELSGQESSIESTVTNKMSMDFDPEVTNWFVEYSGGSKDKLSEKNEIYPWEKLIVDTWDVTLKGGEDLLMKLNKNWELKYDLNGDYLLSSSDLFVKTDDAINMNLRFLNLQLFPGAIASLNQNEVASTVNLLSWKAEVSSFSGKKIQLKASEKLSITNIEATKEDLDLESKKEEIWNYFFSETWAIDNDLVSYLDTSLEEENSWTGTTASWSTTSSNSKWKYIEVNGLEDNKSYGSSTIDISGSIQDERVSRITFNGTTAPINLVARTYELKSFSIPLLENDIVYKIYDSGENILERWVYTVYYKEWLEQTAQSSDQEDFPVTDSNPQFAFTAPSPNPYTSNENFITIRWKASPGVASSVMVNGLKLKSFNGTTWRYHASTQFGTLKNGVNLYKVNYYDNSWAVIHTNTFTIIRKVPAAPVVTTPSIPTETPIVESNASDNSGWDTIADRIPLD